LSAVNVNYKILFADGNGEHNHIEITNKMQPCTRIDYSNVY